MNAFRSIPLVYQTILMIFALSGALTKWRDAEGLTGTNLLKVLIMDQGIYYTVQVVFYDIHCHPVLMMLEI